MGKTVENVTVVRHLRPYMMDETHHNIGGATFLFELDYKTRQVVVMFAICASNENFNRKKGVEVARVSGVERILPLDGFQKLANNKGGFIDAYWDLIKVNGDVDPSYLTDRERLLLKKIDYNSWR